MTHLLLHPVPPAERPGPFLLPVLAFVALAAIALSGGRWRATSTSSFAISTPPHRGMGASRYLRLQLTAW